MKKQYEESGPNKWVLVFVMLLVVGLMLWGGAYVYAEDFYAARQLGDTYDTVYAIYDISGVVQDTTIYTNISFFDTARSSIAAGLHHIRLDCYDGSGTFRASFDIDYPYQSGLTLTSADYDSISAGITAAGSGTDTVVLYAVDTSSTPDSLVPRTTFAVRTSGGATVIPYAPTTLAAYTTVYLDTGTYYVAASAPGYKFPTCTLTVTANSDSSAVKGYGSFLTNHVYVYGSLGPQFKYANVTISMPEFVNNHCDSSLLSNRRWPATTGSDGSFGVYVPYSSCWVVGSDTAKYVLTVEAFGTQTLKKEGLVFPDTSSYKVFW